MMSPYLGAALVVALVAIGWLLIRYTAYRARFKFTDADVKAAREDTKSRSRSVLSGKVQEQLAPLFPEFFAQFNPVDARFLGSPFDFLVFDGLDGGELVERVVFVEVKSGNSKLNARERLVRDAIQEGRVEYQLLRLPLPQEPSGSEVRGLPPTFPALRGCDQD
jgi:predicted Holliday junction resolvase-like endonuclease